MKTRDPKYWIIVASKDHVKTGQAEGIAQACHGKASPLKRMRKDDFILYYSGKQTLGKPDKCQEFTAIGKVIDDDTYTVQYRKISVLQDVISIFYKARIFLFCL